MNACSARPLRKCPSPLVDLGFRLWSFTRDTPKVVSALHRSPFFTRRSHGDAPSSPNFSNIPISYCIYYRRKFLSPSFCSPTTQDWRRLWALGSRRSEQTAKRIFPVSNCHRIAPSLGVSSFKITLFLFPLQSSVYCASLREPTPRPKCSACGVRRELPFAPRTKGGLFLFVWQELDFDLDRVLA